MGAGHREFLGHRGNAWESDHKTPAGMVRERPHVATVAPDLPPPVSTSISRAKRLRC